MEILFDFPAYALFDGGNAELADGAKFAVPYQPARGGLLFNFYKLGCVEAYAAKYGEDPAAALAQAEERGEQVYWANAMGACIHNGAKVKEVVPLFELGAVIAYRGKKFRLDAAANHNVKLVEVAA